MTQADGGAPRRAEMADLADFERDLGRSVPEWREIAPEDDSLVVDGDSATWKADVVSPMGPVNLAFSAVVSGDSLTGKVTTPMGPLDMSGVRQA